MKPNHMLIAAARGFIRKHELKGKEEQRLRDLIEEYERACDLSQGKNKQRSEHWSMEAAGFEQRLRSAVSEKIDPVRRPPRECCGA